MAVKIIKPGKLPDPDLVVYRGTCGNCGCVVDVTPPIPIFLPLVTCPTNGCGRWIGVKKITKTGALEERVTVSTPTFGPDGRCRCTCADACPLGKTGSETRCHKSEMGM